MGTPDFAVATLRALVEAGEEVVAVVCQPDRPKGRKREPAPPPVKVYAQEQGISVLQPNRLRGDAEASFLATFRALNVDLAVVAAYGQILPASLLETPRHGCINVHASLLPCYRGAAPIQSAIMNGDGETGITIMQMDEGMDTGDILYQASIPIYDHDTSASLHDRLAEVGAEALLHTLGLVRAAALTPRKQDDEEATVAPMLKKEHGLLDWSMSAEQIHAHVRGVFPWPGAFTTWNGRTLKVFPFERFSVVTERRVEPGTILSVSPQGFEVSCGAGSVWVQEVQLDGRKRMEVVDFLRGNALEVGMRLGDHHQ